MPNDLQKLLKKFIGEYESELMIARRDDDYKRPFGKIVRQDITSLIRVRLPENTYKVKGSVGAGRWTDVPWIAVFDKRITTSAQKGVYIVYFLNKMLHKEEIVRENLLLLELLVQVTVRLQRVLKIERKI